MRAGIKPRVHLFVCENRRDGGGHGGVAEVSPLGPGCGAAGERVTAQLKAFATARGIVREVWVTKTRCLGLCPREGTTVALYPRGQIFTEVLPTDCPALFALAEKDAHA